MDGSAAAAAAAAIAVSAAAAAAKDAVTVVEQHDQQDHKQPGAAVLAEKTVVAHEITSLLKAGVRRRRRAIPYSFSIRFRRKGVHPAKGALRRSFSFWTKSTDFTPEILNGTRKKGLTFFVLWIMIIL